MKWSLIVKITLLAGMCAAVVAGRDARVATPTVTLLTPVAGQILFAGDTMHITWEASADFDFAIVEVSGDSGYTFHGINPYYGAISRTNPAWGDFACVIPDSIPIRGTVEPWHRGAGMCVASVRSYVGTAKAVSALFTILPRDVSVPSNGRLQIDSPVANGVYHVGDTLRMQWRAVDTACLHTCLFFTLSFASGSGGSAFNVIQPPAGSGQCLSPLRPDWESFPWVIPAVLNGYGIASSGTDACVLTLRTYEGNLSSAEPLLIVPQNAGVVGPLTSRLGGPVTVERPARGRMLLSVNAVGCHGIDVCDCRGARIAHFSGAGAAAYSVPTAPLSAGVYVIKSVVNGRRAAQTVVLSR